MAVYKNNILVHKFLQDKNVSITKFIFNSKCALTQCAWVSPRVLCL